MYDMIRYDMLHNSALNLRGADELLKLSAAFENSVVPQEYGTGHTYILTYIHTYIHSSLTTTHNIHTLFWPGIDKDDKRFIGSKMCGALLEKIEKDLTTFKSNEQTDDMHYKYYIHTYIT